ncbi:MAG: putative ABC transporter permease [Ruminococcus sp.]
MNLFLTLAFLFCIGSVLGWGLEVLFRRFFSAHHWVNPGFLVGPYLPLYGSSLCILYLLAMLEPLIPVENAWGRKLLLFVLMALAITLVEYIAGLIFIRGMKIKLWDYSERWGNIQGIICPLFSFFWAILQCNLLFFDSSAHSQRTALACGKSGVFFLYWFFLWCIRLGFGILYAFYGEDSCICSRERNRCPAGGIS